MATVLGTQTLDSLYIISTDVSPASAGGTFAQLGSFGSATDGSGFFLKTGVLDTDWTKVATVTDLTGYVPYVGATTNVNLGNFGITATNGVFKPSATNPALRATDDALFDNNADIQIDSIFSQRLVLKNNTTLNTWYLQTQSFGGGYGLDNFSIGTSSNNNLAFFAISTTGLISITHRVDQIISGNSTFFGTSAGALDNLGASNFNTAFGWHALAVNISGVVNTAVGYQALSSNTSSSNTAFGYNAGRDTFDAGNNTYIGESAGRGNVSGGGNTAIGKAAGLNALGSGNIFIGFDAGRYAVAESNALYINNKDLVNTTQDKTASIIYGVMSPTFANQFLTINGILNVANTLATPQAGQRAFTVNQGTSFVSIGTLTTAPSVGAIYINQATPDGTNYAVLGDTVNNVFNAKSGWFARSNNINFIQAFLNFATPISVNSDFIQFNGQTFSATSAVAVTGIRKSGDTITWDGGTLALQRQVLINQPIYSSSVAGFVITEANNVEITGAVRGSGANISIVTSTGLNVKSASVGTGVATGYGIFSSATIGAGTNWAIGTSGNVAFTNIGTSGNTISFQGRVTATTDLAMYMTSSAPSSNNYVLRSDGSTFTSFNDANSIFLMVANNAKMSASASATTFTQSSNTGTRTAFTFICPDNTNATAGTNMPNFKITGSTYTYATGALPTQYFNYLSANTVAFNTLSTATDVYTLFVEASIASPTAVITNNWSAGFNNKIFVQTNVTVSETTEPQVIVKVNNSADSAIFGKVATEYYLYSADANSGFAFYTQNTRKQTVNKDGRFAFINGIVTSGAVIGFDFQGSADTGQTASTQINRVRFSNFTRQWNTGALALQQEMFASRPVWLAVGASTFTFGATFGIEGAPQANTNLTLTETTALYIDSTSVASGGGSAGTSYGLYCKAQTGATNNYSAKFTGGLGVQLNHLVGNSTAPTIVAGTGAGTTPTVSLTNATDLSGMINVTTGTTPTASATVVTITFNTAYGQAPNIVIYPANANTALLSGVTQVFVTSTTTTFVITAGSTALTATTAYQWFYTAIQ